MNTIEQAIADNIRIVYDIIHGLEFIPKNVEFEELEQIGRIALWQSLITYNEEEHFCSKSTYCYRRVRSAIIDYARKSLAVKRKDIIVEDPFIVDVEATALENVLLLEIGKYLSKEDASMFIDKYYHSYTIQNIADKYKITLKQARSKLNKCKNKLKKSFTWEV